MIAYPSLAMRLEDDDKKPRQLMMMYRKFINPDFEVLVLQFYNTAFSANFSTNSAGRSDMMGKGVYYYKGKGMMGSKGSKESKGKGSKGEESKK